jgi:hypothetical protein
MPIAEQQPWFHAAIGLLDVRRQDRLLAIDTDIAQARDLAALVGNRGELVLVLRDRKTAERLADLGLPQLQVFAHELTGDEQFGTFDAALIAPATGPLLPLGAYADLARRNLRPGGRLVVDVPGHDMVPDVASAWTDLGWDRGRLAPLEGVGDDRFAEVLRGAGLRNVHAVLGAHLMHVQGPAELVDTFGQALALDDDERVQLTHAIVRRRGGTGPLDALVHRTRLQALR